MIGTVLLAFFVQMSLLFGSAKLYISKSSTESGRKIITINGNIAMCCIYEWM